MNKNIGIVLSGGGVRAIAHIGLLEVLRENDIHPNYVSGTSGGAMVGALYAAGYSKDKMLDFFKETPLFKLNLYSKNKPGIMDTEKYAVFLKKYFPKDSFESLRIPFYLTATNLLTGQLEYFSKGPLIKPILASAALPPIFSPVEIDDSIYSDGGILNNFPIEPLLDKCNMIIGSYVNPIHKMNKKDLTNTLKLIQRVYHIGLDGSNLKKYKDCDYVFSPPKIVHIGVLDGKSIIKSYKIGYEYAKDNVDEILACLNNKNLESLN